MWEVERNKLLKKILVTKIYSVIIYFFKCDFYIYILKIKKITICHISLF